VIGATFPDWIRWAPALRVRSGFGAMGSGPGPGSTVATQRGTVNNRLCAAFLPWLVFDLVCRAGGDGVGFAAAAALAAALVTAAPDLRAHTPSTVETTGIVLFAVLVATAVAAPGPASLLAHAAVPVTTGALALVLLLSTLRMPATTDYARKSVRPSTAHDPRFGIVNTTMTALWGVAVALVAGSQAVAAFVTGPHVASVFGWLVPLGILLAVAKATAGLWSDYHERDVARSQGDSLVDGLLWDVGLSGDDEF